MWGLYFNAMAENKRSFLLYTDIYYMVEKLTDEKSGQLFKHILAYVNDKNPVTDDVILQIAFEPIKQSLKRDLRKYEINREKRILAGQASANKRQQVSASVEQNEQVSTHSTVSVSDSVSVINISFDVFWDAYDKKEDRVKCERKWNGLTDAEREACMVAVPAYVRSTPDKKFRKNPATYLNNKSWTNEIISNTAPAARPYTPPQTPSYINKNYVQPV